MDIRVKRVYEPYEPEDGHRVLVDRIWPRGLSKDKVRFDIWMKDIAPSDGLRAWFAHDDEKWEGFKSKYFEELFRKSKEVAALLAIGKRERLTLLFSAKNESHNNAVALREYLMKHRG